jgi:type II secretory pathway pseudopilin PulG
MTRSSVRDESGVALVLALSFMVLIGLVTTALLSSLMSAVQERSVLDNVRNRQYAADGAVEQAIATVRGLGATVISGQAPCGPFTSSMNGVSIHVDCTPVPVMTRAGFIQRNVVYTSCLGTASSPPSCPTGSPIVRAQVNYESVDGTTITKTYIQSWTVAR